MPPAYARTFGDVSELGICTDTPGTDEIVGVMFVPPLALNQANSCWSATSGVTSDAAAMSGLIAGP